MRVYKLGGPALEDPGLLAPLARELRAADGRAVVVHGGGRHVERLLRALAIESRFVDGRRETSPAAMEVVEMVLSGVVNKALAAGLTAAGVPAVGISGRDAGLMSAGLQPDLGRVGSPSAWTPRVLQALWQAGLLPVVSPGLERAGRRVRQRERRRGGAGPGRRPRRGDASSTSPTSTACWSSGAPVDVLAAAEARRLIDAGTITGGMSLKVRVALAAAGAGIARGGDRGQGTPPGRLPRHPHRGHRLRAGADDERAASGLRPRPRDRVAARARG